MWLNVLIAVCVGILTYAVTMYVDYAPVPGGRVSEEGAESRSSSPSLNPSSVPMQVAQKIPAFSFTDLSGQTHGIEEYKDHVVVLNFWASWCPPCVKEFPDLLAVAGEYKDQDVVLVALSSDHDEEAMNRFLGKLDLTGENVLIARDINSKITHDLFQTYKLPETLIIGKDLSLRHKLIGAEWTRDDLKTVIDGLL